jgi:hypothetical protein
VSTINSAGSILVNATPITVCSLQLKILANLAKEISELPAAKGLRESLAFLADNVRNVALQLNAIDAEKDLDALSPDLQRCRHNQFFGIDA